VSTSVSAMPTIPQYLADIKDETKAANAYARTSPQTQGDLAAFQKVAPDIQSAQDLLGNYRALNVVLSAYGLSSLSGQTAVVRDLLTQSPTSSSSLAAKSGNAAWKSFAEAFSSWSPSPFSSSSTVDAISQKYVTAQFEQNAQTETPGLGNALYFTRAMQGVTSLQQIMGDSTLLKVAETVAGFDPTQFGALDYNEQVRLLTPKINMSDFSTPAGIQKYAEQYLAILQFQPEATTTPATMLSLYGASSDNNSIVSLFTGSGSGTSLLSLFS
jgi:hypothetical protein